MPAAAERPDLPAPGVPHPAGPPERILPSPPERISAGPLVLRRMHADDAPAIALAVGASLEHLRPWMPWATPQAADHRNQLVRIAESQEMWAAGSAFIYVMTTAGGGRDGGAGGGRGGGAGGGPGGEPGAVADPEVVGTIGLHRRVGDDAIEIGYWTAVGHIRRGYATAAARALTSVALALPGVRHVEIHCDEANVASAAVPRKLGYRLERMERHEPEAPGEVGRRLIWVFSGPAGGRWPPDPAGRRAGAGAEPGGGTSRAAGAERGGGTSRAGAGAERGGGTSRAGGA